MTERRQDPADRYIEWERQHRNRGERQREELRAFMEAAGIIPHRDK